MTDTPVRFWTRVDFTSTCWLWTGARQGKGYGSFWMPPGSVLAHRWAYEFCVEPIPRTLQIDHLCRVRHCVNPDHLEPVTSAENTHRGLQGVLYTHCRQGHRMTPDNIYTDPGRKNRACRTCRRQAQQARRVAHA